MKKEEGTHSRTTPLNGEELRQRLTPEQYHITREHGTEPPFTGEYWNSKTPGLYVCVCCGAPLFDSDHKYDSGTGWPSFWQGAGGAQLDTHADTSHGMRRVEVTCSKCASHLGHVFEDGPQPSGQRYCINSAALKLEKK